MEPANYVLRLKKIDSCIIDDDQFLNLSVDRG